MVPKLLVRLKVLSFAAKSDHVSKSHTYDADWEQASSQKTKTHDKPATAIANLFLFVTDELRETKKLFCMRASRKFFVTSSHIYHHLLLSRVIEFLISVSIALSSSIPRRHSTNTLSYLQDETRSPTSTSHRQFDSPGTLWLASNTPESNEGTSQVHWPSKRSEGTRIRPIYYSWNYHFNGLSVRSVRTYFHLVHRCDGRVPPFRHYRRQLKHSWSDWWRTRICAPFMQSESRSWLEICNWQGDYEDLRTDWYTPEIADEVEAVERQLVRL